MASTDKLVVAGFILLLLGLSYLFAVAALAPGYLIPATAGYLLVAALLILRVTTKKENE